MLKDEIAAYVVSLITIVKALNDTGAAVDPKLKKELEDQIKVLISML